MRTYQLTPPSRHTRYCTSLIIYVNDLEQFTYQCELSIDETMLKAKGRFQYKQYIKIKPIKWGIKLFTVAESTTGYVLNVLPYTGKRCVTNYGKTTQTVLDVAKDFLMKGHKFFFG